MTQPKGRKNTAAVCEELAAPVAQELGVYIWDTIYEKEGAGWYLRYFIDKDADGGVTIEECETFSRTMSTLLDEADPIKQSYCLEVGSPGIERKLTKDWHFDKYMGSNVFVRLIRPVEGQRDFCGQLAGFNPETRTAVIHLDEEAQMEVTLDEAAYIRLSVDF